MRRDRGSALAACVLLAFCSTSCAIVATRVADDGPGQPGPKGATLHLDGEELQIQECYSGDREYFLGVDLLDTTHRVALRVILDPLGMVHLRVTRSGGDEPREFVLAGPDCSQLQAEVGPTGWRVNGVRDVRGSLEAECHSPSGGALTATVRFSHCH